MWDLRYAGAAGSDANFSDQVVSGIVGLIQESGSSAVDLSDADTVGSALTKPRPRHRACDHTARVSPTR